MGKKTESTGYYVRVRPDAVPKLVGISPAECERIACEDLVKEIRRHVDNEYATTIVEDGRRHTCEWCQAMWTEDEDIHNGGCCDKDIEVLKTVEEGYD